MRAAVAHITLQKWQVTHRSGRSPQIRFSEARCAPAHHLSAQQHPERQQKFCPDNGRWRQIIDGRAATLVYGGGKAGGCRGRCAGARCPITGKAGLRVPVLLRRTDLYLFDVRRRPFQACSSFLSSPAYEVMSGCSPQLFFPVRHLVAEDAHASKVPFPVFAFRGAAFTAQTNGTSVECQRRNVCPSQVQVGVGDDSLLPLRWWANARSQRLLRRD